VGVLVVSKLRVGQEPHHLWGVAQSLDVYCTLSGQPAGARGAAPAPQASFAQRLGLLPHVTHQSEHAVVGNRAPGPFHDQRYRQQRLCRCASIIAAGTEQIQQQVPHGQSNQRRVAIERTGERLQTDPANKHSQLPSSLPIDRTHHSVTKVLPGNQREVDDQSGSLVSVLLALARRQSPQTADSPTHRTTSANKGTHTPMSTSAGQPNRNALIATNAHNAIAVNWSGPNVRVHSIRSGWPSESDFGSWLRRASGHHLRWVSRDEIRRAVRFG
jgi:hypothetical protein